MYSLWNGASQGNRFELEDYQKRENKGDKMKIGIIGVGKVGAALAFGLLFHPKVTDIYLFDEVERKLKGEYEDLEQANLILETRKNVCMCNLSTMRECDFIFISAGIPRQNSSVTDEELLQFNVNTVGYIINFIGMEYKDRMFIITNPADILGEKLNVKFLGDTLDHTREVYNRKSGKWILDQKGFTNWGIVAEAYKVVQ